MPAPAGRGETLALANQLAHWAAAHLDQVDARRTEPVAAVTITIPGEGFVGGVQLPVQLVELLTGLLAADTPERHDRTPDTAPATPGLRVIEGGAR